MDSTEPVTFTAFSGLRRIASGSLAQVAHAAKEAFDMGGNASVLVFDDASGDQIDLDYSVDAAQAVERLGRATAGGPAEKEPPAAAPRGPGRPRLGVVAREVTLLPRHWEWLAGQPGGASVALRKLVEQARKASGGRDRRHRAQESAYRFMSAIAGNLAGFEEAVRALFAADRSRFDEVAAPWPADVADYARRLGAGAFAQAGESEGSDTQPA